MKFKRSWNILALIAILILSGCSSQKATLQKEEHNTTVGVETTIVEEPQIENTPIESEETPIATERQFDEAYMYVIVDSVLLQEPQIDAIELQHITIGKAIKVLKYEEDWCFVQLLNVNSYHESDDFEGWVQKSNIGYYESLSTNIGVDVLIKEGFEPTWSEKFPYGLWGEIYEEKETEFGLKLYGASVEMIKKENLESFFKQSK